MRDLRAVGRQTVHPGCDVVGEALFMDTMYVGNLERRRQDLNGRRPADVFYANRTDLITAKGWTDEGPPSPSHCPVLT
ncbi:MAG: hypothetical protein M3N17_00655 [Actinomycetota bacterium]|nr:hypothetical protein [Actinomycetota bacterium]